jgi:hypothetical protein
VPLSRFVLRFTGGGPVAVTGDPCTGPRLRFAGTLTGHNGANASTPARAVVTGCPATARGRLRHGTLRVVAAHGRDAKPLRQVAVRVPRGLTIRRVSAAHVGRSAVRIRGRTATVRLRRAARMTLRLAVRGRGHGRPVVTLTRTNGRRFTVRLR